MAKSRIANVQFSVDIYNVILSRDIFLSVLFFVLTPIPPPLQILAGCRKQAVNYIILGGGGGTLLQRQGTKDSEIFREQERRKENHFFHWETGERGKENESEEDQNIKEVWDGVGGQKGTGMERKNKRKGKEANKGNGKVSKL